MSKTILITGASGVIGSKITKTLESEGYLVKILRARAATTSSTHDFSTLKKCNIVLHLAARNNDQTGSASDFNRDNVEFTINLAKAAATYEAELFIYFTSTKAINPSKNDFYGISKKNAENLLEETLCNTKTKLLVIRLPPVYAAGSSSKISVFTNLPPFISKPIYSVIRSIVPIIDINNISNFLCEEINSESKNGITHLMWSNSVTENIPFIIFNTVLNYTIALSILTIGLPAIIVVSLSILLRDKINPLFKQKRTGVNKSTFICFKFQTMRPETPDSASHSIGESYITKTGFFLRKTKIDEIPQAINLVNRTMELIGPRPCLPSQSKVLEQREFANITHARPGITGLAQISKIDMSTPSKLARFDNITVNSRSIFFDIKILFFTIIGNGSGDAVTKSKLRKNT